MDLPSRSHADCICACERVGRFRWALYPTAEHCIIHSTMTCIDGTTSRTTSSSSPLVAPHPYFNTPSTTRPSSSTSTSEYIVSYFDATSGDPGAFDVMVGIRVTKQTSGGDAAVRLRLATVGGPEARGGDVRPDIDLPIYPTGSERVRRGAAGPVAALRRRDVRRDGARGPSAPR